MASAGLWPMACDPLGGWLSSRLQSLPSATETKGRVTPAALTVKTHLDQARWAMSVVSIGHGGPRAGHLSAGQATPL